MKLYATTTSERATKGQGGEYLSIEIFNKDNNIIAILNITHDEWFKNPQLKLNYNSSMVDIYRHDMEVESQKIKGNNQKGENCELCKSDLGIDNPNCSPSLHN